MKKISIKREQSQAGLSFAEREKFRPQVKNKLLLLLALLITAATGAWADEVTFSVGELKNSLPSGNTNLEIPYEWTVSSQQPKVTIARQDGMPGMLSVSTVLPLGKDHTMTVSVPTGGSIDGVTFTTNPANQAQNISASTGSCSKGIWSPGEGDVTSVTFTPTNNFRITDIVVVYSPAPAPAVPKHLITATYREQTRLLEQPLPYATTIGELFESVTGEHFSDLISTMSAMEMPLTGISSNNTSVVSIGELNGASTPVTVNADGKATISINFSGYPLGILVSAISPLYANMKDGVKDADKWTVKVGDGQAQALPIGGLKGDGSETVTLQYTGRLKVKGVKATSEAAPAEEPVTLATPLTIEAITDGTIQVNMNGTLSTGMKYSVNGGTKTLITTTTSIEGLKAGDKVQFYGNGTSTQAYGNDPEVKILGSGDGFKTNVYGNIMSLLDEEGFATKTDLLDAQYVFYGLFNGNTTLNDASELLLPATQLAKSCYQGMFVGCTNLIKAPALPATQLAANCYGGMFNGCSALTEAPVLPATQLVTNCYHTMFNNCWKLATVTCLATSGINQNNSTTYWLQNAGSQAEGTKTFNAVSTANWPSGFNGILNGWTRVNIDN